MRTYRHNHKKGTDPQPPKPTKARNLHKWEGVKGSLRINLPAAIAIIVICAGLILAVAFFLFREYQISTIWDRAQDAIARKEFLNAKGFLQEYLEYYPRKGEALFAMARTSRRAGDFDSARKHLIAAQEQDWIDGLIDLELLLIQAQRGDIAAVERTLLAYVKAGHPEELFIFEAIVKGYLHSFRLGEAIHWAGIWMEKDVQDWQPRVWRGDAYERLHRRPEAIAEFQAAVDIQPDHKKARLKLADLLLRNSPEDALPHYEYLVNHFPEEVGGIVGYARCLRSAGKIDEASAILDRISDLEDGDENTVGLLLRAQLALDRGDAKDALQWINRYERILPTEIEMVHTKALILRRLGRTDEADEYQSREEQLKADHKELVAATEALVGDPNNVELRYKAGTIMIKVGHEEEGARWLISGLRENPNHKPTHRVLAAFYEKQGNEKQAAAHRKRAME